MDNILFRWSKLIDPEEELEWETRLLVDEVDFSIEKLVNRKRSRIASFCQDREAAEALKSRYGGGVNQITPEQWEPSIDPAEARVLRIRDQFIVSETDDEPTLERLHQENPEREILSFPPQLAFGTGGHPTTANCLRFLVDAAEPLSEDWNFLDLGCGSGILSVAAAKLGAENSLAVELDPRALSFAEKNAQRHQVDEQIKFQLADAIEMLDEKPESPPYQIIAANLFCDLLLEVIPRLTGWLRPGGTLLVSGFLTSQTKLVNDCATDQGIPLQEFLRRGKWVAASGIASGENHRV